MTDNPTLSEVQKDSQALSVNGDINVKSIAGNCRGQKRNTIFAETDVHLQKRKKSRKKTFVYLSVLKQFLS